jgi:hypothetical protein
MLSFVKLLTFLPLHSQPQRNNTLEENGEIISQLKFISKIKPGEQVNVDSLSICSRNLFSGIYRTMYGESRDKTFHYFSITIRRAFEKLAAFCNSERISDQMLCSQIVENLQGCISGLSNAKDTYKDDRRFVCDVETLIEGIDSRLEEFKINKPNLFSLVAKRKLSREDREDKVYKNDKNDKNDKNEIQIEKID